MTKLFGHFSSLLGLFGVESLLLFL